MARDEVAETVDEEAVEYDDYRVFAEGEPTGLLIKARSDTGAERVLRSAAEELDFPLYNADVYRVVE